MKAWYAVYTQSGKEALATMNLRRQGFEVYLPRYSKKRSHARKPTPIHLAPRNFILRSGSPSL